MASDSTSHPPRRIEFPRQSPRMSRDQALKLLVIAGTAAAAALAMAARGLTLPPGDLLQPLLVTLLLGAGAAYYHCRGEAHFVLCLTALLHVTLYSAAFCLLMYTLATMGRPLVDDVLARWDAACGVHLPAIVHWASSHPAIRVPLEWAYHSLLWQTPLVIVVLGFSGDRRRLEGFVRQFLFGTLICAGLFALFPAEGPFAYYGYETSATQARYLEHLHGLRDGSRTVISWNGAEGLITFPSFHTAWALLLAWSLRGRGWLGAVSGAVNLLVIVSTLTTGWHYFVDVLGGMATVAAGIALSAQWERSGTTIPALAWASCGAAVAAERAGPRRLPISHG
jgi:hypothetical protein